MTINTGHRSTTGAKPEGLSPPPGGSDIIPAEGTFFKFASNIQTLLTVAPDGTVALGEGLGMTDVIKALAETGAICEAHGHWWELYVPVLEAGGVSMSHRECRLCGKEQSGVNKGMQWSDIDTSGPTDIHSTTTGGGE